MNDAEIGRRLGLLRLERGPLIDLVCAAEAKAAALEAEVAGLRGERDNFLTFGQGGASFQEAQWIDKVRTQEERAEKAEAQRDAALAVLAETEFAAKAILDADYAFRDLRHDGLRTGKWSEFIAAALLGALRERAKAALSPRPQPEKEGQGS